MVRITDRTHFPPARKRCPITLPAYAAPSPSREAGSPGAPVSDPSKRKASAIAAVAAARA